MDHYNVKTWQTHDDLWADGKTPTNARYYDTRLTAAKKAAYRAVDELGNHFAQVVTTSGEVVYMASNCGPGGTAYVDFTQAQGR